MRHGPCLVVLIVLLPAFQTGAVELGFEFSGFVTTQSTSPFGVPIESFSAVNGRFVYETESSATHDPGGCDCVGYRQQLYNGLSATFGSVPVRADDYIVRVTNDREQPGGGIADIFSVRFASDLLPPLQLPLSVAGLPQEVGVFDVSFVDHSGTLFDDFSLPGALDFGDFDTSLGLLSDTVNGEIDVVVLLTSLEQIPVYSGDYDFDQDVDEDDFLSWRSSFGHVTDLAADGNRNLEVDAADYTVWRDNLGAGIPDEAALAMVPEPSTLVMILPIVVYSRFRRSIALRCWN